MKVVEVGEFVYEEAVHLDGLHVILSCDTVEELRAVAALLYESVDVVKKR